MSNLGRLNKTTASADDDLLLLHVVSFGVDRAIKKSDFLADLIAQNAITAAEIAAIDASILALDVRVDATEAAVIALDSRLDTAESNITSLDGRLDTAETDIAALEVEVASFVSGMSLPFLNNGEANQRFLLGVSNTNSTSNPRTMVATTAVFYPFTVGNQLTFTKLGFRVATGVAATTGYAAIYENTKIGAKDVPGTRLATTTALATTASGMVETTGLSFTLEPGTVYWAMTVVSSSSVSLSRLTPEQYAGRVMMGRFWVSSNNECYGYTATVAGAPPADASGLTYTAINDSGAGGPPVVHVGF